MKITNIVCPQSKYNLKCPNAMTPEFIVVHNTANDASALSEILYMINNDTSTSFHAAVDDIQIVTGIPFNRNAWHAGDGRNGNGNRKGIGIEICYSKSGGERFNKAEDLAAEYIAYLLKQYNWGIDKVKKHQDFSGKYCPHRTLDLGWNRFLNKIQNNLNGQNYIPTQNTETSTDRIKELQNALNSDFNCNLVIDGMIGPLTTNAVMNHYLKYFIKGNFVKWVQTQLKRKGYDLGSYGIDSSYGHDMEKAVLQFQKDYNLTQDKCVGIQVVKNLVN